jgi:hypothetical protein
MPTSPILFDRRLKGIGYTCIDMQTIDGILIPKGIVIG